MKKYTCLACGNEFESYRTGRNPKYCSRKCAGAKMKGVTPWNKGVNMWKDREHPRGTLGMKFPNAKKASEETRKKLSESHTGLKYPTLSAGNHWNWKGGISKERDRIKHTAEYRKWRKDVFERDKYTCLHCGQVGGHLQAHHIVPFSKDESMRFEVSNGETLCRDCHKKTDSYGRNK